MADGTVTIKVDMNDDGAEKGVSKLKQLFGGLQETGEKVGSSFKNMLGANLISSAVIGGVQMLGNGIKSMAGELSDASKAWQTFQGNLEQLGKSPQEINAAKAAMQDFATKTIYSASDMASTYAQLAAVGTKNTGELVKGFGGLAAASENPAQAMKTLSQQATQMAAKPKVAWEDFKLMLEQSPAGMAAVAKDMGMSVQDLIKGVQAGTVSTDEFFKSITRAGTSDTFTKMATEFKTTGQALDGLKESVTNKLLPIFQALDKVGIKAVSAIGELIDGINFDKISASVKAFLATAVAGFSNFFGMIGKSSAIQALSVAFTALSGAINHIKGALSGGSSELDIFGVAARLVISAIQMLSNIILALSGVINSLSSDQINRLATAAKLAVGAFGAWKTFIPIIARLVGFSNPIGLVVTAILGLVLAFKNFDSVKEIVSSLSGKFTAFIANLKSILPQLVSTIVSLASQLISELSSALTTYLPQLLEMGKQLLTTLISGIIGVLPDLMTAALGIVTGLVNALLPLLPVLLDAGMSLLMALLDGIVQAMPAIMTAIAQLIQVFINGFLPMYPVIITAGLNLLMTLIQGIISALPQITQAIITIIQTFVQAIVPMMPQIVQTGIELLKSLIAGIIQMLPDLLKAGVQLILGLGQAIVALAPVLLEAGVQIIWALIQGAFSLLGALLATGDDLINGLLNTIGSFIGKMLAKGGELIANFITGIGNKIGEVTSKVSEIGNKIISTITGFAGDLVSAGADLIQGFANGIADGASSAIKAAGNMAKGAVNAVKNMLGIHSPSRVFRDQVGKFIPSGISVGISANAAAVKGGLKDVERELSGFTYKPESLLGTGNMTVSQQAKASLTVGLIVDDKAKQQNQNLSDKVTYLADKISEFATKPTIVRIGSRDVAIATYSDFEAVSNFNSARMTRLRGEG
jgi:tape measure domain-containing protein